MTSGTEQHGLGKAAEDLALIRQMMEAGRSRVAVSGVHFILWGILLTLAFFLQYLSVQNYLPPMMVEIWVPMSILGWLVEFYLARQCPPAMRTSNPSVVAHTSSWAAVGITTLGYFAVSVFTKTFDPKIITILSSGLIGSAYWVTSAVTGVRWLRFIAFGWWAVLAYATSVEVYNGEMLLVMAAASAFFLTLPGFVMRRLNNGGE
ncbi:hypothetical protein [Kordiimonas sp.]|uniref:hypothetical protein n=1 Tax=Kordiimonas sp. TaxID=1970157 RepID=UPI003A8E8BF6